MNAARFVQVTLELVGWDVQAADAAKAKGLAPLACNTDKVEARRSLRPRARGRRRRMLRAVQIGALVASCADGSTIEGELVEATITSDPSRSCTTWEVLEIVGFRRDQPSAVRRPDRRPQK